MSKRILSDKQKKRIQANQAEIDESKPVEKGRVVAFFGKQVEVENTFGQIYICEMRQQLKTPVVGDYVNWQQENDNTGIITSILPRETLLARYNLHGKEKPLAANISQMLIVFAPIPAPNPLLIDRYIVAARNANIDPVFIFNKFDLIKPKHNDFESLISCYQDLHISFLTTSAKENIGLSQLQTHLKNNTSVLVGQSGVGKSSLINRICPDTDAKTDNLGHHELGRHTTSMSRLYPLDQNSAIIDSPGIREFTLDLHNIKQLMLGYPDIAKYTDCKFRDCQHIRETGCAVIDAVQAGLVNRTRWENYKTLRNTLN